MVMKLSQPAEFLFTKVSKYVPDFVHVYFFDGLLKLEHAEILTIPDVDFDVTVYSIILSQPATFDNVS